MKKVVFLAFALTLVLSSSAYAKNVWQMAESPKYGEKAGGMVLRGLLNAASSPVDMPVQAVRGAREHKPEFVGAVGGFTSGAVCTILRASSGIIDVAAFWIPGFNGLPVSRSYENCLDFGERAAAPPPAYAAPAPEMIQQALPPQPVLGQQPAGSESGRMKYIKK